MTMHEWTQRLGSHKQKLVTSLDCIHCRMCSVTQMCPTLLQTHELQPTRLLCPWDFPGKNTGVGCHALLQGIFPTQGLNPHLESPALAGEFLNHCANQEVQYREGQFIIGSNQNNVQLKPWRETMQREKKKKESHQTGQQTRNNYVYNVNVCVCVCVCV